MAAPKSSTSATSTTAPPVEAGPAQPDHDAIQSVTAAAGVKNLMQLPMPAVPPPPNVYACIAAVCAELAQTGISKDRKNEQQNYKFRGIDDVYNSLAPVLAKHGLVIVPRIVSRDVTERVTGKGTTLFYVTLCAEFQMTSAKDGSSVDVRTYGEAMDSGDKATNKAMSAAYKYAALMTFCIPTEGDNDADATTQETTVAKPPAGFEDWFIDMVACADNGVNALKTAWTKSKPAYREYAQQYHAAEWVAAKKKSAVVDKNKQTVAP